MKINWPLSLATGVLIPKVDTTEDTPKPEKPVAPAKGGGSKIKKAPR